MEQDTICVEILWDSEAAVWFATSEDVRGLVVEAKTADEMEKELHFLIPLLIDSNKIKSKSDTIPLELVYLKNDVCHLKKDSFDVNLQ